MITAVVASGTVNAVRFEPEGLQFQRSAYLTMSYANCDLLHSLAPKRIAYTTDALDIVEYRRYVPLLRALARLPPQLQVVHRDQKQRHPQAGQRAF